MRGRTLRTGTTVVTVTFKNIKTAKSTAKKYRCVVKAALEQKPEEPATTAGKITAIKQTSATKLAAEFSADMTGIKYTDLKIVRDKTGAVVTVKSATVDKDNNTKVAIETYEALTDGETYTVTYTAADEAKTESSANFTATAGVVADIALNTYSIPANTPTVIKYQLLDANGVLIEEKGIGGKSKSDKVDISIENFSGYQNENEVTLYQTGDKATMKVVYHTWKYNNTDGTEEGKVEKSFELIAVDPSNVIETYEYSIANGKNAAVDFKRDTLKKQIALEDDKGADPWAHFYFCKADGTEITDNLDYSVSSGNENVILANGSVADGAQLTPVGVGATYLMIKDAKGAIVKTLPITVVAKRELSTMTVDKSSVTVAQNGSAAGTQRITIAVMDQYADAYKKYTPATKPEIKNGKDDSNLVFSVTGPSNNKTYVDVYSNGAAEGTYVYTLDLTDDEKGTNVKKVTFSVTVSKNLTAKTTYGLVIMDKDQEHVVSKVDTTVNAGGHTAITLMPTIVEKNNGSITGKATIGATEKVVSYGALTLTKNGVTVKNDNNIYTNTGKNVQTNNAVIKVTEYKSAVGFPVGTQSVVKNLEAGTYTLTLTATVKEGTKTVKQNMSTSFVVEDSQKVFEATVKDESVEKGISTLEKVFENTDYVTFSYAGHVIDTKKFDYQYVSAETTYTNVKKALRVKKVTIDIELPGTDNIVRMTANVDRTFTFVDDITSAASVSNAINAFNSAYTDKDGSLKDTLSTTALLKVIDEAQSIKANSQAASLTASEQAALEESADKAIEVAKEAAVAILSSEDASAATSAVYEVLGYSNVDDTDYNSDFIEIYNVLAPDAISGATTYSVKESDEVVAAKNKLEKMFTAVINAVTGVEQEEERVNAALLDVVSGTAVVGSSKDYSYEIAKVTADAITVTANVTKSTAGAVNVTSISAITASAISGKINIEMENEGGASTVSGAGVEVEVRYNVTISKTLGSGDNTIILSVGYDDGQRYVYWGKEAETFDVDVKYSVADNSWKGAKN